MDGWSSMEDCSETCDHNNRKCLRQMEEDERWCREEDERAIQQWEAMAQMRDCSACGQLYFPQFDGAQMCATCEDLSVYPSDIDSEDY